MVMINGDVAGLIVRYSARCVHKGIPDRWPLTIFVPGAFHLVSGGCTAPSEVFREGYEFIHFFLRFMVLAYWKKPGCASNVILKGVFILGDTIRWLI
jgi:hypothetical protein